MLIYDHRLSFSSRRVLPQIPRALKYTERKILSTTTTHTTQTSTFLRKHCHDTSARMRIYDIKWKRSRTREINGAQAQKSG